ncbi:MAG TPA: hypothetical protein VGG23_03020, partial [Acidimicrobiales bacterium]
MTESNVPRSSEASAPRTDGRSAGGDLPRTDGHGDGRPDYRGPFDAAFDYEDLSKDALVRLVREYALIVHILDRSMCAAIGLRHGLADMEALAIEEWKGASP